MNKRLFLVFFMAFSMLTAHSIDFLDPIFKRIKLIRIEYNDDPVGFWPYSIDNYDGFRLEAYQSKDQVVIATMGGECMVSIQIMSDSGFVYADSIYSNDDVPAAFSIEDWPISNYTIYILCNKTLWKGTFQVN